LSEILSIRQQHHHPYTIRYGFGPKLVGWMECFDLRVRQMAATFQAEPHSLLRWWPPMCCTAAVALGLFSTGTVAPRRGTRSTARDSRIRQVFPS